MIDQITESWESCLRISIVILCLSFLVHVFLRGIKKIIKMIKK
jgi:hypothetical protein